MGRPGPAQKGEEGRPGPKEANGKARPRRKRKEWERQGPAKKRGGGEGQALPQRENGKARIGQKERGGPGPIKSKGRRKPGSAHKEKARPGPEGRGPGPTQD